MLSRYSLIFAAFWVSKPAFAFQAEGSELVLAGGAKPRLEPNVVTALPNNDARWNRFVASAGGTWRVMWDRDTRVAMRIWGSGISFRGSMMSPEIAERASRTVLSENVSLLAPGALASDFELVSNVFSDDEVRTVAFRQLQDDLQLDGGQISFRFKKDRLIAIGSEALPRLDVFATATSIPSSEARRSALAWITRELGARGRAHSVEGPLVRAIVLEDGSISAARVMRVIVSTESPIGRWAVDVDAATGAPFARKQLLKFATGRLLYHVPERWPGGARINVPAALAQVSVAGQASEVADDGSVVWSSTTSLQLTTSVVSSLVRVDNDSGPRATTTLALSDGMDHIWDESGVEQRDSQLTTFIAAKQARDYMKGIAPRLGFLDEQLLATVNIGDVCNAFSDGTTINFFLSGEGCENTGRLPDVVHHEYGHSVHAHAIIEGAGSFDSSLSEGASDYLAATIADDPAMGVGFFFSEEPLRHVDPEDGEATWPQDRGESHVTGLIYAGAMWDLRKAWIEQYGQEEGVRRTDLAWYATLQRAANIPASYVEVLVADDDDGDLSNGTPNVCAINRIFAAHGLATLDDVGPEIGAPQLDGFTLSVPVAEGGLCADAAVTEIAVAWELRGQNGSGGRVVLTKGSDGRFEAAIPPQPEGEVLRYRVEITRASGFSESLPKNPADPMYELFIGDVTPIYCTDFESDPMADGWTHRLVSAESDRATDEWQWGTPGGVLGSGDPSAAFSGDNIVGNDLGSSMTGGPGFGRGTYGRSKVEELMARQVDASGHQKVRLHYRRWLTVEDGDADRAEIWANGANVWSNYATGSGEGMTHHLDTEWRFHDVDLTDVANGNGGLVTVSFMLATDRSLQFGGWNIDDFCIVGWDGPTARCGDNTVQFGEQCDDGNAVAGDGCEADCTMTVAMCGNGRVEAGEACDDGNAIGGDGCETSCQATTDTNCQSGFRFDQGRCVGVEPLPEADAQGCSCRAADRRLESSWLIFAALGLLVALRRFK